MCKDIGEHAGISDLEQQLVPGVVLYPHRDLPESVEGDSRQEDLIHTIRQGTKRQGSRDEWPHVSIVVIGHVWAIGLVVARER
jgi:hypothetical protein